MANPSSKRFLILGGLCVWVTLFALSNYVAIKTNQRFDLTREGLHTLSPSTIELIKEIKSPIKLTAFYVGMAPKYLEDLLKEYEKQSAGNITSTLIDPLADLGYAAQFGTTIKSGEQKLIVQSGGQRKDVDFSDRTLNQNDVNNALIAVSRTARHACFLAGHGEADPFNEKDEGFTTFAKNLLANNIIVQTVIAGMSQPIPETCDVLVIAGPKENLRPEEETAVNDYLKAGGDGLVMVENVVVTTPDQPLTPDQLDKNPSLNGILGYWGLKVNNDIAVDLDSHASGDVGSPATKNYMSFRDIVATLDYTFYIRPRSISILPDRRKSVKVTPFIFTQSTQKSWGETNRMLEVKFDPKEDRPGPVPIGFVAFEPKVEGERSNTRLIIITDTDFLTNAYISYYNNALLGLKAINWLTETDYKVFVDEKEIKVDRLQLTSGQKRAVVLTLILIPLLVLLTGALVTLKRK